MAGSFNGVPVPKVYPVVQSHTWLYLKDRAPFSESHFVMESTAPVHAVVLLPKNSCDTAMRADSSNNNNNDGAYLLMPSPVCSSSIGAVDPSTSDAVSNSSSWFYHRHVGRCDVKRMEKTSASVKAKQSEIFCFILSYIQWCGVGKTITKQYVVPVVIGSLMDGLNVAAIVEFYLLEIVWELSALKASSFHCYCH